VDSKNLTLFNRIKDSDIYFSFIKSPTAIVSTVILIIIFFCSFFVEFVTPYNPFDPSSLSLMDAFTPPSWTEDGLAKFILGTDGQGRDMLATILYGSRISLIVGFSAVIFALVLGVGLGWQKFTKSSKNIISIESYGASGPGKELIDSFGFSSDRIFEKAKLIIS